MRIQLAAIDALANLGDARASGALGGVAGRNVEGRVIRAARLAQRTLGQKADKGEEVKSLKDEVEKLQQGNQELKDRLVKLEAAVNGGTSNGAGAKPAAAPKDAATNGRVKEPTRAGARGRRG